MMVEVTTAEDVILLTDGRSWLVDACGRLNVYDDARMQVATYNNSKWHSAVLVNDPDVIVENLLDEIEDMGVMPDFVAGILDAFELDEDGDVVIRVDLDSLLDPYEGQSFFGLDPDAVAEAQRVFAEGIPPVNLPDEHAESA